MSKCRLAIFAITLGLSLGGCSSSGPKTHYYALFAGTSVAGYTGSSAGRYPLGKPKLTVGVGPVRLPEYLDTSALVTLAGRQQISVSGRHAWAGDLEQSITRVVADELSRLWQVDGVWAFPWDNRIRPDYQVDIVIERLIGQRAGELQLQANWSLKNKNAKTRLLFDKVAFTHTAASDSYEDYVVAMNLLLLQLADHIAAKTYEFTVGTL